MENKPDPQQGETPSAVERIRHLPIMDPNAQIFTFPMAIAALMQGANALKEIAQERDDLERRLLEAQQVQIHKVEGPDGGVVAAPCQISGCQLAAQRPATAAAVLDKPAMVGNTRFGVNVQWATVIERAQREYEYQVTPEKEAERMKRVRQFVDAAAGTAVVPPYSDITPQADATPPAPEAHKSTVREISAEALDYAHRHANVIYEGGLSGKSKFCRELLRISGEKCKGRYWSSSLQGPQWVCDCCATHGCRDGTKHCHLQLSVAGDTP